MLASCCNKTLNGKNKMVNIISAYFVFSRRFRVLKDTRSMKTLKTKSEYSTLTDFIEWLKEAKGESDGLILLYHDNNKQNVTPFLIEALERYKMSEEFFKIVKGFVNCVHVFPTGDEEKDSKGSKTLKAVYKKCKLIWKEV